MEKIVTIPVKVEDVMGLLVDLKKNGFAAVNIGADQNNTYVYLDISEEKDPVPIMESWVGKSPPPMEDRDIWNRRAEEIAACPGTSKPTEEKPPSILSRIFRKIMG